MFAWECSQKEFFATSYLIVRAIRASKLDIEALKSKLFFLFNGYISIKKLHTEYEILESFAYYFIHRIY